MRHGVASPDTREKLPNDEFMAAFNVLSSLSEERVLGRLQARAKEWRESTIPEWLQKRGVYRAVVRVSGATFHVHLQGRTWLGFVVEGRVEPLATGSRLVGQIQTSRLIRIGNVVWVILVVGGSVWGGAWPVALLAMAIVPIMNAVRYRMAAHERAGLEWVIREAAEVEPLGEPEANEAAR